MKLRNALMAAALIGAPTVANAQASRSYDFPSRIDTGPYNTYGPNTYVEQPSEEELISMGKNFSEKNVKRLVESDERYHTDLTNPYNGSSLTNRLMRRFDLGRIGGGVGRVFRDCGMGSGTFIAGAQSAVFNDNVLRGWVIDGLNADDEAQAAYERGDNGAMERWGRIADSNFRSIGYRVFKHEITEQIMEQRMARRCMQRPIQRGLNGLKSPLRGILPGFPR